MFCKADTNIWTPFWNQVISFLCTPWGRKYQIYVPLNTIYCLPTWPKDYPCGRRVKPVILISIHGLVPVWILHFLNPDHIWMGKITVYMVLAVAPERLVRCPPRLPGNGQFLMSFPYGKLSPVSQARQCGPSRGLVLILTVCTSFVSVWVVLWCWSHVVK